LTNWFGIFPMIVNRVKRLIYIIFGGDNMVNILGLFGLVSKNSVRGSLEAIGVDLSAKCLDAEAKAGNLEATVVTLKDEAKNISDKAMEVYREAMTGATEKRIQAKTNQLIASGLRKAVKMFS
jgi:hypothetical protein